MSEPKIIYPFQDLQSFMEKSDYKMMALSNSYIATEILVGLFPICINKFLLY